MQDDFFACWKIIELMQNVDKRVDLLRERALNYHTRPNYFFILFWRAALLHPDRIRPVPNLSDPSGSKLVKMKQEQP